MLRKRQHTRKFRDWLNTRFLRRWWFECHVLKSFWSLLSRFSWTKVQTCNACIPWADTLLCSFCNQSWSSLPSKKGSHFERPSFRHAAANSFFCVRSVPRHFCHAAEKRFCSFSGSLLVNRDVQVLSDHLANPWSVLALSLISMSREPVLTPPPPHTHTRPQPTKCHRESNFLSPDIRYHVTRESYDIWKWDVRWHPKVSISRNACLVTFEHLNISCHLPSCVTQPDWCTPPPSAAALPCCVALEISLSLDTHGFRKHCCLLASLAWTFLNVSRFPLYLSDKKFTTLQHEVVSASDAWTYEQRERESDSLCFEYPTCCFVRNPRCLRCSNSKVGVSQGCSQVDRAPTNINTQIVVFKTWENIRNKVSWQKKLGSIWDLVLRFHTFRWASVKPERCLVGCLPEEKLIVVRRLQVWILSFPILRQQDVNFLLCSSFGGECFHTITGSLFPSGLLDSSDSPAIQNSVTLVLCAFPFWITENKLRFLWWCRSDSALSRRPQISDEPVLSTASQRLLQTVQCRGVAHWSPVLVKRMARCWLHSAHHRQKNCSNPNTSFLITREVLELGPALRSRTRLPHSGLITKMGSGSRF